MAQKHNEEQINAPMTRLGTMALSGQQRIIRSSAFAAANFTADNPVMQLGEMGYETDTGLLKVGDGVTAWSDLPYVGGGAGELPNQTGNAGKFLTTDGTDASWGVVDALPDQTGQSGKFLTTDGTDASWATINALQNTSNVSNALGIIGDAYGVQSTAVGATSVAYKLYSTALGSAAKAYSENMVAVGKGAGGYEENANYSVAVGADAGIGSGAKGAIQLGKGTNSTAGTFAVGLTTNGTSWNQYEVVSADGTIPAARHASLPATDGTYVLKCVISGGVPTLSWVAE